MAGVTGWIYSTLSAILFGSTEPEIDYASERYSSDRYGPSIRDVLAVKEALRSKTTLPYELIDTIVDMAEYWPHTTTSLPNLITVRGGRHDGENRFVLRSYPVGYLPLSSSHSQYRIEFERNRQSYETAPPKPWPESRYAPNEATQELLSSWTTKSLPKSQHPCRKIVFTIESHDQGFGGSWGHRGTYEGSYTWFDVGLERVSATREDKVGDKSELIPSPQFQLNGSDQSQDSSGKTFSETLICSLQTFLPTTPQEPGEEAAYDFHHDLLPSPMALQRNATATRDFKEYKITWSFSDNVVTDSVEAAELDKQGRGRDSANGEFVRNLKIGDVVTIWAKARFPQWLNVVGEVKMDVYWAV